MTTTYVEAWRKNDPQLEADAMRAWSTAGILPKSDGPEIRVKQLALVAYVDGNLAGLSTLNVRRYEPLKQQFAFMRGFVMPEFRMHEVGRDMMAETLKMIEQWAFEHQDEQIAGMMAVVQIPGVGKEPTGWKIKATLISYVNGNQQLRLKWFDHFRVPPNMTDF
ncbi:MAG: hypothetical protein V4441_09465 [Pseudomonadota bacterium]